MSAANRSRDEEWEDLLQALEFLDRRLAQWQGEGAFGLPQLGELKKQLDDSRANWKRRRGQGAPVPEGIGLPPAHTGESAAARSLRYWIFAENMLKRINADGALSLAQRHALQAEARERRLALERRVSPDELPEVVSAEEVDSEEPAAARERPGRREKPPSAPRRNMLEILLDPRNIQWLLAFGGALFVVGLVILLWVNDFFTPPTIAIGMGLANAALLLGGWWLLRFTRYHLAGRALTLLACLVMPLNLWYYHTNGLMTLDGHLWLAALVMSVLYLASALVLRDEVFVYVFVAGADPDRAADPGGSPTVPGEVLGDRQAGHDARRHGRPRHSRRARVCRSGRPVLSSRLRAGVLLERPGPPRGRAALAAGRSGRRELALRAGLQIVLRAVGAQPSPIISDLYLRWLAVALTAVGTFAYVYSDLVVRRVGVYVHIAAFTLLWTLVLLLELLNLTIGFDAWIIVFAVTALVVNVCQASVLRDSAYTRAFPILGVLLPLLAVLLGLVVYLPAVSPDLKSVWSGDRPPPSWSYLAGMLLTAISCRVGAYLYRHTQPGLSTVYFFATAAATMVGAVALLAALGLNQWQHHAPILMLVPIAYLVASHLYREHSAARPLMWVSHAATGVMLISSLATALSGFDGEVLRQPLNLYLALFFAEGAVFYGLAAGLRRQVVAIHLCAALSCATVWQLINYIGLEGEYYTLSFAIVGLAMMVGYRLAVVERFAGQRLADAVFQSANTLLSLSFVAAALLFLSRFAVAEVRWSFVGMCGSLTLISLLALSLVSHAGWRRWYVVTTIGQALLTFLGLTILSTLSLGQKLEIFSVCVGLLLLVVGHVGWYREQERQRDLVSISLFLGSWLLGLPLAIATLIDRGNDEFIWVNELGFLAAGILLLTSGFLFQLKSTTLTGATLTVLYFVTLVIRFPWSRINTLAIFITVGGGVIFSFGLILSVYRDRLLMLPERIKRREGVFRVLNWR